MKPSFKKGQLVHVLIPGIILTDTISERYGSGEEREVEELDIFLDTDWNVDQQIISIDSEDMEKFNIKIEKQKEN